MQKSLGGQIVIPSQITSAIPIVDPSVEETAEQQPKKVSIKPVSKGNGNAKRLCRNVIIHGYCKYEGKGCEFNHDSNKPTSPQTSPDSSSRNKLRFTPNLQAVSSVTADSINAPEFVPRFNTTTDSNVLASNKDSSTIPKQPSFSSEQPLANRLTQLNIANDGTTQPQQSQSPSQLLTAGVDPYFYMNQQPMYPRQPLQHHLYASPLPHVSNLLPHQRTIQSFFIPDQIREELTQRNEAQLLTASGRDLGLPLEVHVYHSLVPLDTPSTETTPPQDQFYGHPSSVYKATCSVDGRTYALVRIEGFRLVNELAMSVVEAWRRIRHCNIVSVREAFTTRAFGDSSLIFAFDYHPCSSTLYTSYFTSQTSQPLPEETLWSYITQIASALKTIHGSGLAARNIDLKKILITGKNRLRISGSSILDVLQFDNEPNVARQQQEDILSFAKLIMALACHSLHSHNDLMHAFEYISHHYSPDIKNLLLYILSNPSTPKNIDEILAIIGPRILHEINNCHFYNDELESELSRELENGRLVRLMAKMGFINERPEFDMDPGWSETGDRYLIKLFRDYVFHQVDEKGQPVIDMVHVLTCLNKLDAGVDEKIMLMSRDEQSCLIVSFREIKNCIMSAFNDLTSGRK
ncbi:kinase-like domain-containing protein [Choanephora cucurbitarum]|nr:kinase-like domain-containing protein [Choanephora cucurbitarum]